MKTTRYLYDIEPTVLVSMPYEEALWFKIKAAKELLHYLVHVKNETHTQRVEDIQKAIDFNKSLLQELKGMK